MAALKLNEDATGRMVLQPALRSRLGGLLSMLVWVGILIVFFFPSFGGGRLDPEGLITIIFVLVFVLGGSLLGALLTNQIVVDQTSRTVTSSRRLLGIPLSTTQASFGDIDTVENQFYRQASGRTSHNAWRVMVNTRDNRRIAINWDGKQEEMAALAQKVANMTGAQVVENATKPVSTAQEILDRMRGQPEQPQPPAQDTVTQETAEQETAPAMPDTASPPPVAMPYLAQEEESSQPAAAMTTEAPAPSGEETARDLANLSVAELEQRVKVDSMDVLARHVLARKYQASGQPNRAVPLYQEALHIDPMNVDAQNDLGVALEQQRKRTEAEAAYRRAIGLDPFSSTAHLNLGLLLRGMNRAPEASQEFYQARQNAQTDSETRAAEAASTGGKLEPQLSNIFQ
jgi:Flp pilus assembly protein TadD